MKLGFTGTQSGMTVQQITTICNYVAEFVPVDAHMGDCIGADHQFHDIINEFNNRVEPDDMCVMVGHIPIYDSKRAFCLYDEVREPKPYLDRNHDIVNESDLLIVAPKETSEQLRSGTWATYRYAKKHNKHIIVVYPNGDIEELNKKEHI